MVFLPNPPAEGDCAGPFPNSTNLTIQYYKLNRGHQVIIPAMNFTGCGKTLRWHIHGKVGNSIRQGFWWSRRDTAATLNFAIKLWRPTPSGNFIEVRPEQSFTPSTHFITEGLTLVSVVVDYQVTFSPGDIPGLSAGSTSLTIAHASKTESETGWFYWVITTSTSPTEWNQDLLQLATTVTSGLPLLTIQGKL